MSDAQEKINKHFKFVSKNLLYQSMGNGLTMRHKILDLLNISLRQDIVEVDEIFLRESFK